MAKPKTAPNIFIPKDRTKYYHRRRVPLDLVKTVGKNEIRKSLGTADFQKAKKLGIQEDAALDMYFDQLRMESKLANDHPDQLSQYDSEHIHALAIRWLHFKERDRAKLQAQDKKQHDEATVRDHVIELETEIDNLKEAIAKNDNTEGRNVAGAWLKENKITFDRKSDSYHEFSHYMTRAILAFYKNGLRIAKGMETINQYNQYFLQGGGVPSIGGAQKTITLEELVDEYLSDPKAKRNKKTYDNYRFTLEVLQQIIGPNVYVHTISRDDCERVLNFLVKLPSNASKKFPGLSLEDAAKAGEKIGAETLSAKSVNKYVSQLSALLNFAMRKKYIAQNCCEGLKVYDPVRDIDRRPAFTDADMKLIFSAPLFTGCCDDERSFMKPGNKIIRRARFWIPLIGAFSGMRLNEICQLEVDDIFEINGIYVMDINASGKLGKKQYKTKSSIRKVPIHPELIKVGFVRHVQEIKNAGKVSIFPELEAPEGKYKSDMISRKINLLFERLGLKDEKPAKCFHSFRKTFATKLSRAGANDDAVDEIGGWKKEGIRREHYLQHYSPQEHYDFIARVEYDGLDLSHLYV